MQLNQLSKNTLQLFGPIPALIEKHSGRFRYQLIIQASNRKDKRGASMEIIFPKA